MPLFSRQDSHPPLTVSPWVWEITWAKGYYDTAYGRISAEWRKAGKQIEYLVSAPAKIKKRFLFDEMHILEQTEENGNCRFVLIQNN